MLERVLDRLGGKRSESREEAEEPLEATDVWRRGDGRAAWWPRRVRGEYE